MASRKLNMVTMVKIASNKMKYSDTPVITG